MQLKINMRELKISIDYINKRLYLYPVNNRTSKIMSVDYNGNEYKTIVQSNPHVETMAIFGDILYLQKHNTSVIHELNVTNEDIYHNISLPKQWSHLADIVVVDNSALKLAEGCPSSPCGTNAYCSSINGTYSCKCYEGFIWKNRSFCQDIDECSIKSNYCDVNADCTNNIGSYVCQCPHIRYFGNGEKCTAFIAFKDIPPISVTADRLIENFFHIPLGNTTNRRIFLQDNVVVLDSSASIGKCEYKKGKRALKFLMDTYSKRGDNYDYYWAGVQYSTKATIKFKFQPAIEAANLLESTFKYEQGWTNTGDGLAKAKDIFDDFSAGGRRGADQVVFLVTDGNSNRKVAETIPNAQLLKDDHVEIFVVAIGAFNTGIDEMVRISSIAHEDHVLRVATFGDFLDVVKLAIKKVAPDTYKVVGKIPPPC